MNASERERAVLASLDVGVVIHAPDNSIIFSNPRASEILGLSEDQLKGKRATDTDWKFLREDKTPLPLAEYPVTQILVNKKEIKNILLGVNRPNTMDIRWVNVNGIPVLNNDGEISEIIVSFIDITERKKIENDLLQAKVIADKVKDEALRAKEEADKAKQEMQINRNLLNAIIENAPIGVALYRGPDAVVELINPMMKTMAAFEVVENRPAYEKAPPELQTRLLSEYQQAFQTGHAIHKIDREVLGRYFSSSFIPMILPKNEPGTLMIGIETTDQVILRKELENQVTSLENVLALVSHDIRNPLTSISLGAQLIMKTPGQSDKHQPILLKMMRTLEYTDSLIQTLLDVSRLRAGKNIPLEFQYCDLNAQILKMVEEMPLIEKNRLIFNAKDSVWGAWGVTGIRRVIENLVTNAVKYGDPNTAIEINLVRSNDLAVITVHNQGPEIPLTERAKLFEAFQRTRDTEASNRRGWGLGLALVKGIADSHSGIVKVDSAANTGTTFILELPIRTLEQILVLEKTT